MPEFRYIGYNRKGRRVKGTVVADTIDDVLQRLRSKDIYPDTVEPLPVKRSFLRISTNKERLALFSRQLSILLSSGVPLSEALRSISGEFSGDWKRMINRISERVQEGASLSRTLKDYNPVFPEYYSSMIEAAEQSGNLPEVLDMLAEFIEVERSINSKITGALLYPMFMVIISVFVLSFVFTFVVPKIIRIFDASKASLPFVTKVLIKVSHIMQGYWWLIGVIALAVGYLLWKIHKAYPQLLHGLLLRFPLFRSLYYSRFTGTFGFLLKGGVPVIKALELSSRSSGNSVLQKHCTEAIQRVSEGASISSSIEGISPVLRQLISTGEQSGSLSELMLKASGSYREEFLRATEKITTLIEPVIILIMGFMVGIIVFGVLLPIFQLNQLIH
jgi:general secretion pathway protein F